MRILQFDVNNVSYEPIKPEASIYEDVKKEKVSLEDILVIFTTVEDGDDKEIAKKAIQDTDTFMKKLARKKLLIYPFAHLSGNLASPKEAMQILDLMYAEAKSLSGIEVWKAPFGWNKKLELDIKAHPLAEQSRSYRAGDEERKTYTKAKPTSVNTAIVRKSDWSGLPQTDHRTIGERLDLYSFQEVSPAMVYWHPKGHVIYRMLMGFIRSLEEKQGYLEISTPSLNNVALWYVSGHAEHYKGNMFLFDSDFGSVGLKPMNCPSTILIYKSRKWSYRELPFRTAIFDKLYRKELSGAVTGLFRVKELTQDDGHIFVTEEQIGNEVSMFLGLVKEVYSVFGMKFAAKLSTMPDDHIGDEALWEKATEALKAALKANNMEYEVKEKEGAFYGPKIDFDVFDSIGRIWQCATIQVDYQMPIRFGLEYAGEDGKAHTPIIIHRAALGSLERFIGILTEHYQGKFPTWIAPVQARVISISEQAADYAAKVCDLLKEAHIRAELDVSDKTLEYKIRDSKLQEIPYTIIVGKREVENERISVRTRSNIQKNGIGLDEFLKAVSEEINSRSEKLSY